MTQASSVDNYVYEGIWTNWKRGSLLGLTLTLDSNHAAILSPALAYLITIAGAQLWRLIQFALHQVRATTDARPMLYHQLQVTLRNSTSDIDTLWRLIRLGAAWRISLPLLALAVWAVFHLSLVLSFGLFSSWFLQSTNEVLARSPYCGTYNQTYVDLLYSANYTDPEHTSAVTEFNEYLGIHYASVQQHVDICRNASDSCKENAYRPSKIPWTSSYVLNECPFNNSICHPDAGTMLLDTGLLSSFSDLGFNAPNQDRVSFRMLAQCAPLDSAKYSSAWHNVSTSAGIRQLADASYGSSEFNDRNATHSLWWRPYDCEQRLTTAPYTLNSYLATPGSSVADGTGTFDPIPELQLSDADLSLMLLSFNDAYQYPVEDPWFSAQQATNNSASFCLHSNRTLYVRERPLTAMGCTQQWQVCSADKNTAGISSCTPLLGRSQTKTLVTSSAPGITLNPHQAATIGRILDAGARSTFFYVALALSQAGSPPLRARTQLGSVAGALSSVLPSDQWQTETKYWMDILLAYLQQNSLDLGTGQFAASTSYINVSRPSIDHSNARQDAAHWLCQSQIIYSDAYRNFNFFALVIISIVCIIVIFVGLFIEDCVSCSRRRRLKYSGPTSGGKQDMWIANSDLHMLRTIDEVKNGTSWTISQDGIPRTHPSYEVAIDDLVAEGHDVEEGKGIVVSAVKRMQTLREKSDQPPPSRPCCSEKTNVSGSSSPSSPGRYVMPFPEQESSNMDYSPHNKPDTQSVGKYQVVPHTNVEEIRLDPGSVWALSNSAENLTRQTRKSRAPNRRGKSQFSHDYTPRSVNHDNVSMSEADRHSSRATYWSRYYVRSSVNETP